MAKTRLSGFGAVGLLAKCGTLGLSLTLSAVGLARAQEPRPRPTPSLYDRLSPSVVSITVSGRDGAPLASGSGVILSAGGVILTNYHVVEGGVFFDIRLPGQAADERAIPARPLQCAAGQDLATLQIVPVNGLKPVRVAKKTPAVGDHVFAVGSPLGLEGSLSDGIVSQIREDKGEVLIQTTAPISHGSSGGGLFLGDGSLVGITALSIRAGQGLNFAVSADEIPKLVPCTEFQALPPPAETNIQESPPAVPTPPCKPSPVIEHVGTLDDVGIASVQPPRAWVRVHGIVRNDGCSPARFVKVRVVATRGGAFLTSNSAYTDDEMIQPGERSDFTVLLEFAVDSAGTSPSFEVSIAGFLD